MSRIYAQMYSVRNDNEKDFRAALKRIAQLGYDGVEFAGYYGEDAKELRAYMDEFGLETISAHVGFDLLRADLEGEINYLKTLGARYIVCPHTQAIDVHTAREIGRELKSIAKACMDAGMPLLYHNHAHELKMDGDIYPLEVLFEEAPDMLQQPDIFWVQHAGINPMMYLEQYKDRIKIVHLKQIENMDSKKNVDASSGIIDLKLAMKATPDALHIYEQEKKSDTDVMTDMGRSLEFLKG